MTFQRIFFGYWPPIYWSDIPKPSQFAPTMGTVNTTPHGDPVNSAGGVTGAGSGCISCGVGSTLLGDGDDPDPGTTSTTEAGTVGVTSEDPNSLIGPAGYGPSNFVAAGTLLPYQIEFENDPSATSPAQRVDITDQLSPNLDWTTLQLTSVGFGSTYITIPAGLQHYVTTVRTSVNGQSFEVVVNVNLNLATGLLSASFQSIDPKTGLAPANLLTGFLPPEDAPASPTAASAS